MKRTGATRKVPAGPASTADASEAWMRQAFELAWRGLASARPNPLVGAVVVKSGRVVGKGWHASYGGPHAEVAALEDAGRAARGATLVVTLEPCCHQGKTPACTEAVLEAGIRRVLVSTLDPNPRVRGRGAARLARGGVRVDVGCLAEQGLALNEGYFSAHVRRRPWVTLKIASTLDGKLAAADGTSRSLSGPDWLRAAHRLRGMHHAILVGRGTVEADDPQLTTRLFPGRNPVRVVLDGRARAASKRRVFDTREAPTLWVTGRGAPAAKARRLEARGVEHVALPGTRGGPLDLRRVLAALLQRDLQSVLVEGGAGTITGFLRAGLVDRLIVAMSPKLLGAGNLSWLGDLGVRRMRGIRPLMLPRVALLGTDAVFEGLLTDPSDLLEGWAP